MAILLDDLGKYEPDEPLYIEALAIYEDVMGKEHIEYARYLNALADLYREMGNYAASEKLQLETIAIWERIFGKEHSKYAMSLNNLGATTPGKTVNRSGQAWKTVYSRPTKSAR
ncbi:MAG: tetratricopeptide repeat protein [Saprospiraceae bacterium]